MIAGEVVDACGLSPCALHVHLLVEAGEIQQAVRLAAEGLNPELWCDMYDGNFDIDREDMAQVAGRAWDVQGTMTLDHDGWRELFDLAGFRTDDQPDERPSERLVLWRGATPEHRDGWSWADDRDAALMFASGWMVQNELGLIWRAEVEPERLLARLSSPARGFHEYVVDTEDLTIEPDGLWCRCDVDMAPFRKDARVELDLHELVVCQRE